MGGSAAIQSGGREASASLCVPRTQICEVMVLAEVNNSAHQNGNGSREPFSVNRMPDDKLVIFGRTNGVFHVWLARKEGGDLCVAAHPVGCGHNTFLVPGTFRDLVQMVVDAGNDPSAPRLQIAAVKGENRVLSGQDRYFWVGLDRFLQSRFDFWVEEGVNGRSPLKFSDMTAGTNGKKKK